MITGRMKCACSTVLMAMFALASAARAQEGSAAARNSGGDASAAALATPVPPVHYYPKQQVDAGFDSKAGGDMLYNGDGGTRNFTLMTGVRTNPGGGELHMKSTDVIYVVKGSATLVTGGRIAGVEENAINPNTGKPFPKDEIRGKGVEGGEPHHLAAGDVIIVPNGVPHQFSEVEGEFCYHLIKIRQP